MTVQKFSITGGAIWAEPDNLNYFLNTPVQPDSAGGVTNEEVSVKEYKRRRYSGDPTPYNVPAQTRTILVDPGRKSGNALPGSPFICDDGVEKRQFRYTGAWVNVHAFFTGDAAMEFKLYSATGTRYMIAAVASAETLNR